MRSDMHKVVTTPPRVGGQGTIKGRAANVPLDDRPQKESMRKKYKSAGVAKEFSDLINPLRRALRANVGRPWSKVYSEIVNTLPGRGVTGLHILDHVRWEVPTNVIMQGRVPCYGPGFSYGRRLRSGSLYVNPNTGLLCKAK